jgi:hypothetical protein
VANVQTAFEVKDRSAASRLEKLLNRKDFKDVELPDLASIGRFYADWADQGDADAERLLDSMGQALEAANGQGQSSEAAQFWLGSYRWKNGKKQEAQKAFSESLAKCDAKELHKPTEGRLGRIKQRIEFKDDEESAKLLMSFISPAIHGENQDRQERDWWLIYKRGWLIVSHKALLGEDFALKTPQFYEAGKALITLKKDWRLLRAAGCKLIITGAFNGTDWKVIPQDQKDKYNQAHRETVEKWAKVFLEADNEVFREWRTALEDAEDCVTLLKSYAKMEKNEDLGKLAKDLEKKCMDFKEDERRRHQREESRERDKTERTA